MGKNFLPCKQHEPLLFQFTPLDFHFHTMHCHGAWLHLSNLPLGTRGPFSGRSKPSFPQRDQDQIPQLVHIWHVLQFPTILRTLLLPFYDKVSVTTCTQWPLSRQTSYTGGQERNSNCTFTPVKYFSCIKEGRAFCTSHPSKQCPITPIPSTQESFLKIQHFSFTLHYKKWECIVWHSPDLWITKHTALCFPAKQRASMEFQLTSLSRGQSQRDKHMGLGWHSHFKHSSIKILVTLENRNSSTEFKRNKNHISRSNQVIQNTYLFTSSQLQWSHG